MKRFLRKCITASVCALLCATTVVAANAATVGYYNSYSTVASIPNKSKCPNMQGVAVGGTYVYSAKVNSDDTKAVLHKTNQNTGVDTVLTDASTGAGYFTYLGHATDMDVTTIDGSSNLYIATARKDKHALVRMKVSGTTLQKVGNYRIMLNGVKTDIKSVKVLNKSNGMVNLLFRRGDDFYKGSVGINTTSGDIAITKAFSIDTTNVKVNGKVKDLSVGFTRQGCCYYKNRIYMVFSNDDKPNVSIIAVYDGIDNATGVVKSNPNLSFRITSKAYTTFEMEGCGISSKNGKLYFSANRRVSDTDTNHDAIMCFNNYTF